MNKRMISFLLVMALLLSIAPTIELPAIAIPENTDVVKGHSYLEKEWNSGSATTISFADVSCRTVFTDNQQVWEQNGITVINDRAESVQPVQDYADPARFYENSILTIETTDIISYIVFDCASELFVGSLLNSGLPGSDMLHYEGKLFGILPPTADSTFTVELREQVRLDAITVYYGNSFPVWPSLDEQSVLMGKNHIYVSEENSYDGTKCTFIANASGTYVLTNLHNSAYIRCGSDFVQGYGSCKAFYLAKGETIQIVVGPYLMYSDTVSFNIVMRNADETTTEPEALERTLVVGNNAFDGENINYTYTAVENGMLTLRLQGPSAASAGDQLSAKYSINGSQPIELKKNVNTTLELCRGNVVRIMVKTNCSGGMRASWNKTFPDVITEGTCGENLTWTLDENCLLTISGTGEMTKASWSGYDAYIKAVVIENGVTSICDNAFRGSTRLTSIVVAESVVDIGDGAFSDCGELKSITLPRYVTNIGDRAFQNCTRLIGITIPSSVVSIGEFAFSGCSSLTTINVDSNNTNYCSDDRGVLFNKDKTTLISAPGGLFGEYSIPLGTDSIDDYAFSACAVLTGITIPAGITNIGQYAFRSCVSLTGVTIPAGVTSIGEGTFSECDSLWHVLYVGTEERWNTITIENNNDKLISAKRHYLCDGDEITDYGERMCRICLGQKPAVTECPHDMGYVYEEKAPSCAEAGYARNACVRCGYSDNEVILPAVGPHVMPESVLVTEQYTFKKFSTSAEVTPEKDVTLTCTAKFNSLGRAGIPVSPGGGGSVVGTGDYISIQKYDAVNDAYNTIAKLKDGDSVEIQFLAGVKYRVYSFANGRLEYTYVNSPVHTIPGDCYSETISWFTCAVCGRDVEQKFGYQHNLVVDVSLASTETTYGYYVFICQTCGVYGIECEEPLNAGASTPCMEHNWAEIEAPGATCQSVGYLVCACLDCGEHSIQILPQQDHTERTEDAHISYPTDGQNGCYWWHCAFCGQYQEEVISCEGLETYGCYENAAAAHDLSDAQPVVFRRGSCTVVGADVYLCNCCQKFIVAEDPTTGLHIMPEDLLERDDPNNQVTVPDVEPIAYSGHLSAEDHSDGHCYYFIMPCDGRFSIIKNSEHAIYVSGVYEYVTYHAGQEIEVNIWSYSGDVAYEVILTIIPEIKTQEFCGKDATCTDAGYTAQWICLRCDELFASEEILATGHNWSDAKCEETRVCSTCGLEGERISHVFGENEICQLCCYREGCYNIEETVLIADLILDVNTQKYTTVSGEEVYIHMCQLAADFQMYVRSIRTSGTDYWELLLSEINADGYVRLTSQTLSWLEGFIWENAVQSEEFVVAAVYLVPKTTGEFVHVYEAVITEPTWETGGYTTYTCTCGDSYVSDYTDPLPYVPGDPDGNGSVNTDDAIYLLYNVMFGDSDYPVNQDCDFDGNGTVNTDDAIYLLYHVMFGEADYPLHN